MGPGLVQIYNDGYRPMCGAKHPAAMGQDFSVCWASTWPDIGEAFARALAGEAQFLENQRMFLDRNGYLEETWFTSSFSPIRDETGGIGGLFHPVTETTARMLSERRVRALRDLAARAGGAQTIEEACARITETLADYAFDLPFALLYLLDAQGTRAHLAGTTGLAPAPPRAPRRGSRRARRRRLAAGAGAGDQADRASGRSRSTLRRAALRPVSGDAAGGVRVPDPAPGLERPVGLLVAGVSARLALDDAYRDHYEMLASAVTTAVSGARAYQEERKRADALAEIDRVKTAFFSNVSHELRTPLTLILGPVADGLADGGEPLSPRQRQRQETVQRNALRLLKHVNTLLDFSRTEAGRAQASFEPLDLAALTADLASNFRSAIERAGLSLVVDAPPSPEDVHVDREMWRRSSSTSSPTRSSSRSRAGSRSRCERPGARRPHGARHGHRHPGGGASLVFERFHRVQGGRSRSHEGTGIGLSLVQELVRLHGGTIHAESVALEGRRSPSRSREARRTSPPIASRPRGPARRPRAPPRRSSRRRCAGSRTPPERPSRSAPPSPRCRAKRPAGAPGSSSSTTTPTCGPTSRACSSGSGA